MPLRNRLLSFWRTLTGGARLDAELDDELRAYVDLRTEERARAGLSLAEARRAALLEVGGIEQVKERVRDARVGIWLDTLWQDVRYAARGLRHTPRFTAVAIASLGLGIGLNSALFTAIHAVILRPLPYEDPDRLVNFSQTNSLSGPGPIGLAPAIFSEWRLRNTVFENVATVQSGEGLLRDGNSREYLDITNVSASFFTVLGVPPAVGRVFTPEEDRIGSGVAVLGHDLWRRRFQGGSGVIGRDLEVNGAVYRVVGIMPPGFRFFHELTMMHTTSSDLYLSGVFDPKRAEERWTFGPGGIARLKPGITLERAKRDMDAIAASTKYGPPPMPGFGRMGARVSPLADDLLGPSRSRLLLAWGAVAVVLLIAAVNTASLLLARAGSRRREMGIRAAVGASRARLVRQCLSEGLLLALAGGLLGLLLAVWPQPLLHGFLQDAKLLVRLDEARLNLPVLFFTLGASVVTGVLFGLVPALRGTAGDLREALTASIRVTESRATVRARHLLLVGQVSMVLPLLTCAGLMVSTVRNQHSIPLGFEPERLLTFFVRHPYAAPYATSLGVRPTVWPPEAPITPAAPLREHWVLTPYANALPGRLVARLLQVPGVTHAAVASGVPMVRSLGHTFSIPGRSDPSPAERGQMEAVGVRVTPGYFAALGMQLLAGRVLTAEDRHGAPPVAVINRRMARMYWRDESTALGHLVRFDGDPAPSRIVGVVSDLRFWPASEPTPQIFTPVGQNPWSSYPDFALWVLLEQYFAVRVDDQSPRMFEAVARAIAEVDAGAPVERVRYMDTVMAETFGNWRVLTRLLAVMSAVALALIAIGIFGVVSYGVSQRTHEIGVRVALGASGGAILRLVLAGGLKIALVSASLGMAVAYWTTRFVEKDLYQVSPTDPIVFGAAGVGLVAVVLLATWLPARRAAAVDPVVALRAE